MDSDQRRHRRVPMEIDVELHRAGHPVCVVRTEDLSLSGVLLVLGGIEQPPLGSLVQLRVVGTLGDGETPPLVDALVVRHVLTGVAVQFLEDAFM